jgi:glucose-1-phosphate thymidylyltransferase
MSTQPSMIVGVIPAAGHARRLGSLPCSKEMIYVDDVPVIGHLIDRMRSAGARDIRVVTRPEKEDVILYVKRKGCKVVLGNPSTPASSVEIGVQGLNDSDRVLLGLPDTMWEPSNGFEMLLSVLDREHPMALGLFRTRDLQRSDVVVTDDSGRVFSVDVKPTVTRSDFVWGCAASTRSALNGLARFDDLGYFFNDLCQVISIRGVELSDQFVDIGTSDRLIELIEAGRARISR